MLKADLQENKSYEEKKRNSHPKTRDSACPNERAGR